MVQSRLLPPGDQLSVREQADLDQALRGTLALDASARRLSRLVEFLDPTDPEGLYCATCPLVREHVVANTPGCSTTRSILWPPACPADRSSASMSRSFSIMRFTRSPIMLYLFHLVRRILDGRRLVCWMDEFWRLLADPAFETLRRTGQKPGGN